MNKRQARKAALEIAVAVISKEQKSPSGLTFEFAQNTQDWNKIADELQKIIVELQIKREKFAD